MKRYDMALLLRGQAVVLELLVGQMPQVAHRLGAGDLLRELNERADEHLAHATEELV